MLRTAILLALTLVLTSCGAQSGPAPAAQTPSAGTSANPPAATAAPSNSGPSLQLPSLQVPNVFGERLTFQGNSMAPAIPAGTSLTVQKANEYKRGDIVALEPPPDRRGLAVRRIVGLPGERLEAKAGKVMIGGAPLEEPYVSQSSSFDVPPVTLAAGQFYVLADNRNAGGDSRAFGPVSADLIHGIAKP